MNAEDFLDVYDPGIVNIGNGKIAQLRELVNSREKKMKPTILLEAIADSEL